MGDSGVGLHEMPSGKINFEFETEWQWHISTDGPWLDGLPYGLRWTIYSTECVSTAPIRNLVFSFSMSAVTGLINAEIVGLPADSYRAETFLECVRHCEGVVETERAHWAV